MNALEASPKGGQILVVLYGTDPVTIRIRNQGAVPPAIRENFFQKFVTAGKVGGTGLGTYSAKLIAEVHGGTIGMETSEADGTTVTIVLPRETKPRPAPSPKIA